MNVANLLSPEILDVAKALGLVNASGDLESSWFENPLLYLGQVLTDPTQRQAVLDLLDQIVPPQVVPGAPTGEKWHPLLGTQGSGNVYLTVNDSAANDPGAVIVGIGGQFQALASPATSVIFELPIASLSGSSFSLVAFSEKGELALSVAVDLNWTLPANPIALSSLSASLLLAPLASNPVADFEVTLEGLDLDGKGSQNVTLGPNDFGSEVANLLVGLIHTELQQIAASASGEAEVLAANLPPLLGLAGGLPRFPFTTLASDPKALAGWLQALTTGNPAPLTTWLGNLAALLGAPIPSGHSIPTVTTQVSGTSTVWSVPVIALDANSSLQLTIGVAPAADKVTPLLKIGMGVDIVPGAVAPVSINAGMTLLTMPLAGSVQPTAFPSGSVIVTAPASSASKLVPPGGVFSADAVQAGFSWTGSALNPLLQLTNVELNGAGPYAVIDLTDANNVIAAASNAVASTLNQALGNAGPGTHLAALVGLVEPSADNAAPLVDLGQLVAHPTAAIATLHRNALLSGAHPWSNYFTELVELLAIASPVTGSGTVAAPWTAALQTLGPLSLNLIAWNAQTSGNSGDPQLLRIGLSVAATTPAASPFTANASWTSELFSVDLVAQGTNAVRILGGHHASVSLTPGTLPQVAGVGLQVQTMTATLDLIPGSAPAVHLSINGVSVTTPAGSVQLPSLSFPFAGGFDLGNPAALGVTAAQLEQLVTAILLSELSSALGSAGLGFAALLGAAPGAAGLQADFPALGSGAGVSLFQDPVSAWSAWLGTIAAGLSSDGSTFAEAIIPWLAGLISANLPQDFSWPPDPSIFSGSGTYDDPWTIPIGGENSAASALFWMEPNGPPSDAANVSTAVTAVPDIPSLVTLITQYPRYLGALPDGLSPGTLTAGLESLSTYLASSDGVVPLTSQQPAGSGWATGTPIAAAHPNQPSDPSACTQILAQVDAWAAPGTNRAVLLLGPAFSDHTTWTTLLAQQETAHPGSTNAAATFNLRVPGVAPASIDLRGVTAVADYYTADLDDDGTGNVTSLSAQIGLVLAQIFALKPGAAIVLVAHSTAGLAALAHAQANSAQLKGIITLGTPHLGSPLTPLTDTATAEALRFCHDQLSQGVAAGPLNDALKHLESALDSYLPAASAGLLPQSWPYPIGSFAGSASTDTGGVPVLALGGQLTADLLSAVTAALAAELATFTAPAPTAVGYGARVALGLGPDGDVHAELTARLDAGRFAWNSAAPPPPRPAQALTVAFALSEEDGWLAGSPLSYTGAGTALIDIRVRSAKIGVLLTQSSGALSAAPFATLTDAAFHSPTTAVVSWGDAQFSSSLGSVFAQIASPAAGTSLATLLSTLQALGVVAADSSGGLAVSAAALTALQTDPLNFLAGKMQSALSSASLPGFTASGNTYNYAIPGFSLEAFISTGPATFGLRTPSSSGGIPLADLTLNFSVGLTLATLQPVLSASLTLGPATLAFSNGTLTLAVPPAVPSLQLYPLPAAGTIIAAFNGAVPLLLIESLGSAVLEAVAGVECTVSGLVSFLQNPGAWIVQTSALGDGTVLDPAKLNQLFAQVGALPGGFTITAAGKNPTTISLANATPIGGVLTIALGITIDQTRHLAPSGTVTIQTNLQGGTWPNVGVAFDVSATGLMLSITPGGGAQLIQLLPTFSGSAALAGAAEALLPAALDGLITQLVPNPASPPPLVKLALGIATALNIYDSAGGFAAHTAQLTAMLNGTWFSTLGSAVRTAFVTSAVAYFNDPSSPLHGFVPGTISASGTAITWTFPIPAGAGSGNLSLQLGWDSQGPTLGFAANTVQLNAAPLSLDATFGYASGNLSVDVGVGISLADSLGISVVPELNFGVAGGAVSFTLLPLGTGTASTLSLQVLPSPSFTFSQSAPGQLLGAWGMPLVADLLINALGTQFTQALWSGGPQIATILSNAQIIDIGVGPAPQKYKLHSPLASVPIMLSNIAAALSPVTISLSSSPQLSLIFSGAGNKLGVGIIGSLSLSTGSPSVSLLFGAPATWLGSTAGIVLDLFNTLGGVTFGPALHVRGLGVGLSGDGDAPLLNESGFSIGAVDAYIAFDLDLLTGNTNNLGGGLEIDKLGLPLNLLDAGSSSNPVAASLLSSDSGSGSGDSTPPNPAVDVIAYYLDGSFTIQFAGTSQPIVIPVHAGFGPVYIDQLDLALVGTNAVSLGVDGSLQINGLTVGIIDLALQVPLNSLTDPSTWSLDLYGLAVALDADPVEISGGLRKNPGPPIEYDGMLSVTVEDIGFTIVAAYSRPSDAQGAYTSLFMFVVLDIPLGGPPFAFIIGLGGGFGYNRELNVPTDMNDIDSFLLVSAIDDDSLANDPMAIGTSIPASRGAYWLAAGVRFSTFALVNSTVVVVIALDRGFEIDILGVSRMALPTEEFALVSVELALKARYNSEEGVLSVQAQLTDNSYLFDPDCQLTGGFAFFAWFPQGQFVLTLGGYNAVFAKPAQFPDVPRLGFDWSVGNYIVIKGGAYFALTNTCVMAGGSLSATASFGPISAWFDCYVDFLVSWDPFAYEFDIGVEVGVSLTIQVCFFACVSIGITISYGAQLMISGPPFHGTASIDAYVTTVTVSFGDPPQPPPYITDFGYFSQKYLTAGDPNGNAVLLQFSSGLLAPNPPGAQPVPGTQAQPWQVGIEFKFQSSTRMPANQTQDFMVNTTATATPEVNSLDLAAMDEVGITSTHSLTLDQLQNDGSWKPPALIDASDHFTVSVVTGFFPEATWHWFDPKNVPAGARTITAVTGISVDGHVVFNTQSALIPISTLVADLPQYALPLPFATSAAVSPTLQGYGAAADSLSNAIKNATSAAMLQAGSDILSGNNAFSQNRSAFGLPASGIPPLASAALKYNRSAPPAVMPITTGLTMKAVGLNAPTLAETLAPVGSVILAQPRLRNVLQRTPLPVVDVPAVLHTTITGSAARAAAGAPRLTPPTVAALTGARLIQVPAIAAPRPTVASVTPRASNNAAAGVRIAPLHQQALDAAAASLLASGVTLAGGAAHVWELAQSTGVFSVAGQGAFRVVFSDRGGAIVSDQEYASGGEIPVPPTAALAIFESLGNLPAGVTAPASGFGAITATFAPPNQQIAVGWQGASTLFQLGPTRLLARGASLRLPRATASQQLRQKVSSGAILASDALNGQVAVETQLPTSITTVILLLDLVDANAAPSGDLAIAVDGGTLSVPPSRVATANRRILFYDVGSVAKGATSIVVSIASQSAWSVAGVIGVRGHAVEWAAQLADGIATQFVPDGPLTPDGSLTVTYSPTASEGATA